MFVGYKIKQFTDEVNIFFAGIIILLLPFTSLAAAQQQKDKFWGSENQDIELSAAEVSKRDLKRLKMRLEMVSQKRNQYRQMVSILQQRVDELSRRLRRIKAMDSNNDKQLIELLKKNKQFAQQISELQQKNKKLKDRLKIQSQKLKNLTKKKKDEKPEDISLEEGVSEVNRLKVRLTEHKIIVEKLQEKLKDLMNDK